MFPEVVGQYTVHAKRTERKGAWRGELEAKDIRFVAVKPGF